MRIHLFLFLALGTLLFACTNSTVIVGGEDTGTSDAGPDATTDGGVLLCGNTTCADGEECCGACPGDTPTCGTICPLLDCPAPLVCGETSCEPDAIACCAACPGEADFCSNERGECPPVRCPQVQCGEQICEVGVTECCAGCDGEPIACSTPGTACPDILCPPDCDAQDVMMVGGCEPAPIYFWNGLFCEAQTGCECEGADCDAVFFSQEACESAFSICGPSSCEAQDARAIGECATPLGLFWNGRSCESLSGCECAGDDCGAPYPSVAICEASHQYCPNCETDIDCGITEYCNTCATGSCPACEDCVPQCRPLPDDCASEREPACDQDRPDCGENAAIIAEGCWVCVNPFTCEPISPEL